MPLKRGKWRDFPYRVATVQNIKRLNDQSVHIPIGSVHTKIQTNAHRGDLYEYFEYRLLVLHDFS